MRARTAGAGALMATCLWMGAGDRADACVCFEPPVAVNEPTGRVFHLGSEARPEALPDATVELRRRESGGIVAQTTTDSRGRFHLGAVRPGTYDLKVSLTGFTSAWVTLEIRKREREPLRGLAIRLDILPDCPCDDACATSPEKGEIAPTCLQRLAR